MDVRFTSVGNNNMIALLIFIYLVGIVTGMYIVTQIEKDINKRINK